MKRYKRRVAAIPPLAVNDKLFYYDKDKGDAFTDQFGINANSNSIPEKPSHIRAVNSAVRKYINDTNVNMQLCKLATPQEVFNLLKSL